MGLVFIAEGKNSKPWEKVFRDSGQELPISFYPHVKDYNAITGAILWRHPYGIIEKFPNISWITSLGAGVDHIMNDPYIPPHVKITRIVDPFLSRDISRTAIMAILAYQNNLLSYFKNKERYIWQPIDGKNDLSIGILGLGEMGYKIASDLISLNYNVLGYSRSLKSLSGIKTYSGDYIPDDFLNKSDVLISVLPLTLSTENILNYNLFSRCKKGTYLVNLGRGGHLNEDDLVKAIQSGIISGAYLDVFKNEPLPADHPFWKIKEITITPHVASITRPDSAIKVIIENYKRHLNNQTLLYEVNRNKGY